MSALTPLSNLAYSASAMHTSSASLKEYISLFQFYDPQVPEFTLTLLTSLLKMANGKAHREVFLFNGEASSGLRLEARQALPKEGYGFFAWVRLERVREEGTHMCVFCFAGGATNDREIQLFLKDRVLHYSIVSPNGIISATIDIGRNFGHPPIPRIRPSRGPMVLPRALPPQRRRAAKRRTLTPPLIPLIETVRRRKTGRLGLFRQVSLHQQGRILAQHYRMQIPPRL